MTPQGRSGLMAWAVRTGIQTRPSPEQELYPARPLSDPPPGKWGLGPGTLGCPTAADART